MYACVFNVEYANCALLICIYDKNGKNIITNNNLAREDSATLRAERPREALWRRFKICEKFTIILPGRQRKRRRGRRGKSKGKTGEERETNMWRSTLEKLEKMRCPALWTDHDDDDDDNIYQEEATHSGRDARGARWGQLCVKVSRAPSKLAAVSNWKTSRRSCMCVRLFVFVSSVCVCACVFECVRVFVALSREIKSGITISRSIAWVIEPHSRMSHCALPQIQSVSKVFPKGFFPTPEK